ncbi:hypothetical protein C5S32_11880 [ANME-1 cluster archaeon GoMg1]|nr:hypothetical protein [ANME-1 cluster archaeon GoMg1]
MKKMGKWYGEVDKNRKLLMVDSYIADGSTCKPSTRKPATSSQPAFALLLLAGTLLLLALAFLPQPALAATPITTCTELQNIKNNLAADYYLANDIDCSCTSGWNGGAGFEPIGTSWSNKFTGTFDGKGYKITHLYINRSSTDYVGLFGYTGSGSEIKNVGLEEVDVSGNWHVGSLVGDNYDGPIINCYSSGPVNGNRYVGGLVGFNRGPITNCYSSGSVSGSSSVGGLVGNNGGCPITNCYSSGSVTGSLRVGGLVGNNGGGPITNCYSSGSVSGNRYVGGLVGINIYDGPITNCYSSGSVSGSSHVGGLVGANCGPITNCYSSGSVTGDGNVGGLVGVNRGPIINCYSSGSVNGFSCVGGLVGFNQASTTNSYWDIYRSGQSNCVGGGSSVGCTGKNSDNSEPDYWYCSTHAPMDNWDFDTVWGIEEGVTYPYLQWQYAAEPPDITSFAPPSPVNDTVCTWRTFNVTVNQTVNVSWYLNGSLLPGTNESKREANYTLHAEFVGENNVSAVAKNANGSDMQTWVWNVTKPEISISKTASISGSCPGIDPLAVSIGDVVTYCFNVTNTGDVTLTGVTVVDDIYGAVTLGTTTLAPGESTEGTVTHVVVETDAPLATNTATATGTDPLGGTVTDSDDCTIEVTITPGISATKTGNVTEGAPSTPVNFSITVSNTGDCTLNPVTVEDTLPAGMSYVADDAGGSAAGQVVTWTLNLGVGAAKTIHLIAHVDFGASGTLNNTVSAEGKPPHGDNVTDDAYYEITALVLPNITSFAPPSPVNDTVCNWRTLNVTVNQTVNVNWYLNNTLQHTNVSTKESNYTLHAEVIGEHNVSAKAENANGSDMQTWVWNVIAPGINVEKTANLTEGAPYTNVAFTINVTNTGDCTLNPVKVVDILPDSMSYVSDDSGGVEDPVGTITWDLGSMASGASTTIHLTAHIDEGASGTLTDSVTATGTPPHGDDVSATDTADVTVLAPGISVTKVADPPDVAPSSNVEFTITVSNTGDCILDPVRVVDTLLGWVSYVSSSPAADTHDGTIIWNNVGPLDPGDSKTITLTALIASDASGSVTNAVTVTGTSSTGEEVTGSDTVTVTVLAKTIEPSTKTLIDVTTEIKSDGTVIEGEQFGWMTGNGNLLNNPPLSPGEAVGSIKYDEKMIGSNGTTEFEKRFGVNTNVTPNLAVSKSIGYTSGDLGSLSHAEQAGMRYSGASPPLSSTTKCEDVNAYGKMIATNVATETEVGITGRGLYYGIDVEGNGSVSAGVDASIEDGHDADTPASRMMYEDKSEAYGNFTFSKEIGYTSNPP